MHFLGNIRCLLISIHALLAESDVLCNCLYPMRAFISIHALLAESDCKICIYDEFIPISIHALLAESDVMSSVPSFLSS